MQEKIAVDTFMIRTDERTCGTVYIIQEKGKTLLIDAGDGEVKLGMAPDICILTHGHYDHTSGVNGDWPKVLLHEREFSFKGPYISIPKNAEPLDMLPLKFGSHELLFFHTPGHTDGSICVLDKKTGLLFSGDTKFAGGGYGRTDLGGSDREIERSLKLVGALPYKLLCPGHGELEEKE